MLSSVLAQPPGGGGPGSDTTAARLNDYRFYGIEHVDLGARYGAPLDGSSHLMTQAAALARYPNCGATGMIEQDTAAWLQAEYDLRTGSNGLAKGGIISLPDNTTMMVSQQLYLQDGQGVWFHGRRNCFLNTRSQNTNQPGVAAVCVSAAYSNAVPLANLSFLAKGTTQYVAANLGGAPHTAFLPGSTALKIQYSAQCEFYNLHFNAYDQPLAWGDNTYCHVFRLYRADACNAGFSWSETSGLNSMERIIVEHFTIGNNNYGFDINATYNNGIPQGGSFFFKDGSFDYNVVQHGRYIGANPSGGAGGSSTNNGIYISGCHIETSPANSGLMTARFRVCGSATFLGSGFEEQGGQVVGLVEIDDYSQASMHGCRVNAQVPLFISSTGNMKNVQGDGNRYSTYSQRVMLLSDANGIIMQPLTAPGKIDYSSDGFGLPLTYQGMAAIHLFYGDGSGPYTFTIETDAARGGQHYIGAQFLIMNCSGGPVTIQGASGVVVVTTNGNPTLKNKGDFCWVMAYAANGWLVFGNASTS